MKYSDYYKNMLEAGQEYQDYIADHLTKYYGIAITTFSSKKFQFSKGETLQGFEIKLDMKLNETGNVYIETDEKSNPANSYYVKSGIYRLDNSIFYSIGDYTENFVFAKKHLISMHELGKYRAITTATSKGFLMPRRDADKYCAFKMTF
jgi:hypothetical protein